MNELKPKTEYDQAEGYFHAAQDDFLRPEEDVVPYSVCSNALKAIHHYLIAYLSGHQVAADASMSVASLLEKCRKIDPDFYQINLSGNLNLNQIEDVYMDMKTVKSYLVLANQTRQLVLDLNPGND